MAPSIDDGAKVTGLAALSQGTPLPGVPKFKNFEAQREYMLNHMAGAFRVFARHGFVEGMAGHISMRDPENPDLFWTNPLGIHFGLINPSDMILVNEDGVAVGGNMSRPANAAGFLIHSAIHRARPDVNAACHFHSTYGKAWSTFAQPLEMLNQDVAIFYGAAQSVYEEFGGIVLREEESAALAERLGEGKVMILRNHGLLTVGRTVDEAAYLFLLMEKSCKIQLAADAAAASGRKKLYIDGEAAKFTYENTSDPESLFAEFQGYLQWESAISHDGYKAMGC
ncbi:Class II aldolase/adducin N-terminal [Penicillium expansum]|uniref:Class II aldolase/adducin N-terminal n=1 Tax=Penicillium expansum TaxID=27334 RepID=A0A0A2JPL9_PENEN|nr:Class II aldolase/adducin N-terminal [Penicillium expansum]KGO43387.1 Class II aldolase/adducin N-terminal [Penicillium expansum]KGO57387.1 Class II aldolase/adducin N-terminal [Penicillium expansum]KGO67439.1 Class II aldolase/adducin N-terminal [Penicillium expansum]